MKYLIITFLEFFVFFTSVNAQCSGGDPSTNHSGWNSGLSIEENYNDARRWEENDRGLPANCLGDLVPPSGGWASLSDEAIALYIHNAEREARGELPFYGVESNLSGVAQAHSDWQIANSTFSHTGDPSIGMEPGYQYTICSNCSMGIDGSSPFQRINQNPPLQGQWESESENLAVVATTGNSIPDFVARSIFGFMYVDAGSLWGHRHNILATYNNNWGDVQTEGFIGVGVTASTGNNFQACAFGCNSYYAKILTVDYYDPASGATGYSFSVLPVELLSFNIREENGDVHLFWETATEKNSDYFIVQRSDDGSTFEDISSINAAGYSQHPLEYSFTDTQPREGTQYYRLVLVDRDGSSEFSKILSVNILNPLAIDIYPNPFFNEIFVQSHTPVQQGHITIMQINGLIVKNFDVSTLSNIQKLDVSDLLPGVYIVHISISGDERTIKVLKM